MHGCIWCTGHACLLDACVLDALILHTLRMHALRMHEMRMDTVRIHAECMHMRGGTVFAVYIESGKIRIDRISVYTSPHSQGPSMATGYLEAWRALIASSSSSAEESLLYFLFFCTTQTQQTNKQTNKKMNTTNATRAELRPSMYVEYTCKRSQVTPVLNRHPKVCLHAWMHACTFTRKHYTSSAVGCFIICIIRCVCTPFVLRRATSRGKRHPTLVHGAVRLNREKHLIHTGFSPHQEV